MLVDFLCATRFHTGSVSWFHEVDSDPQHWFYGNNVNVHTKAYKRIYDEYIFILNKTSYYLAQYRR